MNDPMEYMNDAKAITGVNITPLVDVCLVLVIIFMVTAPFFSQPILDVKLPIAHTAEGEKGKISRLPLPLPDGYL